METLLVLLLIPNKSFFPKKSAIAIIIQGLKQNYFVILEYIKYMLVTCFIYFVAMHRSKKSCVMVSVY